LNPVGAGRDPWSVNFAVSLPIYRDKYRARSQETQFSQEAAEHELQNALLKLSSDHEVGLRNYEDLSRKHLYGDDLLGIAAQALENSKISYQSVEHPSWR
jgi:outer membrane protein, heavy metal efflux system